MQHVYSRTGNLGNECADHAAALGTFGLVSSQNLSTRWAHPTFDTAACFASCNNIGDVLEKLHDIKAEKKPRCRNTRMGESVLFLTGFSLVHTHASHRLWSSFSPFFFFRAALHNASLFLTCGMESPTSCVSTATSYHESFAHNMRNPQ